MKKAVSLLLTLILTLSLCTPVLADPGDEGEENMPQQGQQEIRHAPYAKDTANGPKNLSKTLHIPFPFPAFHKSPKIPLCCLLYTRERGGATKKRRAGGFPARLFYQKSVSVVSQ